MSCYSTKAKPKAEPRSNINKRAAPNPRYEHVKPVVNTGKTVSKYQEVMEQMRRNYKQRKGEIFKRINVTTLVQLMLQVYQPLDMTSKDHDSDSLSGDEGVSEVGEDDVRLSHPTPPHADTPTSARSTLTSVIHGVGEMDVSSPPPPPAAADSNNVTSVAVGDSDNLTSDCPYLLLDIRDSDEYKQCHIVTAKSYPTCMLSRYNGETNEIRRYKNAAGRIIVIYDYNEKAAALQAAETLVQRGFENLFFLSGGLQLSSELFPLGLITGVLPLPVPRVTSGQQRHRTRDGRPPGSAGPVSHPYRDAFTPHDLEMLQQTMIELTLPAGGAGRVPRSVAGAPTGGSSRVSSAVSTRSWGGVTPGGGGGSRAGSARSGAASAVRRPASGPIPAAHTRPWK